MDANGASDCDALIVGAGPAGSHLGYLLAARGHRVAIIDRARFPRDKVCGGGVSRKAIDLLGLDLGRVAHRWVSTAVLTYANRDSIVKEMPAPIACTVVRSEFDALLLDRACGAGATFFPETSFVDASTGRDAVTVATTRGRFRCRLLFAADGSASAVRGRMFGKALVRYAPSLEALVELADADMERFADRAVFDFGAMPNGYGWIFPKRDHVNVGVYSPWAGRGLREQLAAFMACYRGLARPRGTLTKGSVIPLANVRGDFQRGRTWLVGDAAGLAEALFGEGIYFALKSAEIAARAIAADGFADGSRRYTALLRRELLPELRAAARMAGLMYRFQRFAFTHLTLNPQINDNFAGLISGAVGYGDCLQRTLRELPRWLLPTRAATVLAGL